MVKNQLKQGWIPNVFFVTGDISQSGKKEQFERYRLEFHEPLVSLMADQKQRGWLNKIFYIPGNHDVDRDADRYTRSQILDPTQDLRPSKISSGNRRDCLKRFAFYSDFVRRPDVQGNDWLNSDSAYHLDEIDFEKQKYSIVALNTSWLCQGSADQGEADFGKLFVGKDILEHALGRARRDSIKLVLGHHPISHLEDAEQGKISKILSEHGVLYLHGHRHKSTVSQTTHHGSNALHIQSGAAFQAHDDEHYANGVLFGEVDPERLSVSLQAKEWRDNWVDAPQWFDPDAKDRKRPDWYTFNISGNVSIEKTKTTLSSFDQLDKALGINKANVNSEVDPASPKSAGEIEEPVVGPKFHQLLDSCYSENLVALKMLRNMGEIKSRDDWTLTDLQNKFLEEIPKIQSPFQDIILAGGTSSGKTTLAEAAFGLAKPYGIETARIIYVAPTRALAQERYRVWKPLYKNISRNALRAKSVILSTGEDHTDDGALSRGDFFVACLVYEKANVLLSMSPDYLRKINLVIIDELHMIENLHRGCVLESLLAKIKYEKERRSTSLDANNPLRIIGVTTDNVSETALKTMFTHFDSHSLGEYPPIISRSNVRPKSVDFNFLLLGSNDTRTYTIIPFKSFARDELTYLEPAEMKANASRLSQLEALIPMAGIENKSEGKKDEYLKVVREFVVDWMYSNPSGHRLLIFSHTKDIGLEISRYVRGGIKRSHTLAGWDPSLSELTELAATVDKQEMSISGDELKLAITSGVLLHNASIAPRLRHAIEDYISKPIDADVRSEIIIATETLSYGVNLQVDDVFFGSLVFPSSERRPSDGRGDKRLSTNAFFNMAGRAGRLNQSSSRANVVIFVSKSRGDSCARIINEYFGGVPEVTSRLFDGKDVNATRSIQAGEEPKHAAPEIITYPFVRSVLDGMRFLGGTPGRNGVQKRAGATETELVNKYLKRTLFWQQKADNSKLLDLATAATGFTILGCQSDDLMLIEPYLGRPRLTKLGASVIDTGTEIETVLPLRRSMRAMFKSWKDASERPMPFILALLPIIVQEETHRRVIENCPEVGFVGDWNADRNLRDLSERIAIMLCSEVPGEEDSQKSFETVLKEFRNWSVKNQPLNHLQARYPEGIHDACMRIFLGLLHWISGAPASNALIVMQQIYDAQAIKSSKISLDIMSFADGLTWKILFASELLNSMKSDYSGPVQRFDAARLSHRVRLGCVEDSIPMLFKKQDQEFLLSRQEARRIFDKGVRSSDVALGTAEFGTMFPLDRQVAVRDRVREFVNYQISELAFTFSSGLGASAAEAVSKKYWEFAVAKIAALTVGGEHHDAGAVWEHGAVATLLKDPDFDEPDEAGVGIGLTSTMGALRVDVFAAGDRETDQEPRERTCLTSLVAFFGDPSDEIPEVAGVQVIVDFPWLVGANNAVAQQNLRISPASYGVLLGFLTRNLFVDPAGAIEAVRAASSGKVLAARALMNEIFPYLKEDTPDALIDGWVRYMELSDIA
nr:DEAD/DEAH box helicase [Breoghania sp. L-A4]